MARIVPMTPIYQKGQPKSLTERDKAGHASAIPSNIALGQKRARKRDKKHLGFIATLPCVVPGCGRHPVHVAHIRYACAQEGATLTGKATKPDDWRVLPLCPAHHLWGPQAQHQTHEETFWRACNINPYGLARALYHFSGQHDHAVFLIKHATLIFPAHR